MHGLCGVRVKCVCVMCAAWVCMCVRCVLCVWCGVWQPQCSCPSAQRSPLCRGRLVGGRGSSGTGWQQAPLCPRGGGGSARTETPECQQSQECLSGGSKGRGCSRSPEKSGVEPHLNPVSKSSVLSVPSTAVTCSYLLNVSYAQSSRLSTDLLSTHSHPIPFIL